MDTLKLSEIVATWLREKVGKCRLFDKDGGFFWINLDKTVHRINTKLAGRLFRRLDGDWTLVKLSPHPALLVVKPLGVLDVK